MIFKVRQSDTSKWLYYDNIILFKYERIYQDLDVPTQEKEVVLLREDRDPKFSIVKCNLIFKESDLIITCDGTALLLNDEGIVIEEI